MEQHPFVAEPYRTAIFGIAHHTAVPRPFLRSRQSKKIRRELRWLLEHGYDCFIVTSSNRFGRLALEELYKQRLLGARFRLCVVELRGEALLRRASPLPAAQADSADCVLPDYPPETFLGNILPNASAFCSPHGIQMLSGEPSPDILRYYQRLIK